MKGEKAEVEWRNEYSMFTKQKDYVVKAGPHVEGKLQSPILIVPS